MRRPDDREVAAFGGDAGAATVDLALRSGDHRMPAGQRHAIAKATVRALRDAGWVDPDQVRARLAEALDRLAAEMAAIVAGHVPDEDL